MKLLPIAISICVALLSHCATPPKIVDTHALREKPEWERRQAYSQNAITTGDFFAAYKVGETGYAPEALWPLFKAPYTSEQAKIFYASGNVWNNIATAFAAGGGFLIGFNIGTALRGGEANAGLWIGGAATFTIGIICGIIANSKYEEATKLYNNDLMQALDLRQKTSAVKPQEHFAHYSMSVQHIS